MTQPASSSTDDPLPPYPTANPLSPAPTADSTSATLASTLPYLSSLLTPYPLLLNHSPIRGRYITATSAVSESACQPLFHSRAFVQGVHSSYLRRQCGSCWRYNHGKGWQYSCVRCKQIYFCSKRCLKAARQTHADEEEEKEDGKDEAAEEHKDGDDREWLAEDDHFAIMDRGVHALECATLKKMNGLSRVDKDTAGMLRAIIRIYHKLLATPPSNTPPPPLTSHLAASCRHMPTPTTADFQLLIGHNAVPLASLLSAVPMQPAPSSLVVNSHSAFWVEIRSAFVKVLGVEQLPALYSILAKLESNAFGLYAAPKDEKTEVAASTAVDTTEAAAVPSADAAATSQQSEESKQSAPDTTAADNGSSETTADTMSASIEADGSIDRSNLGLKSIGRSLYPSASYFNHSCEPNCEVFETGSILTIHPTRDIEQGDEVTIAYIDTKQSLAARRKQLLATYFFHCQCTRCVREEAADGAGGGAGEGEEEVEKARVSYVDKQGGRERHRKRNAKLKKKKLQTKYPHNDTSVTTISGRLDKLQL